MADNENNAGNSPAVSGVSIRDKNVTALKYEWNVVDGKGSYDITLLDDRRVVERLSKQQSSALESIVGTQNARRIVQATEEKILSASANEVDANGGKAVNNTPSASSSISGTLRGADLSSAVIQRREQNSIDPSPALDREVAAWVEKRWRPQTLAAGTPNLDAAKESGVRNNLRDTQSAVRPAGATAPTVDMSALNPASLRQLSAEWTELQRSSLNDRVADEQAVLSGFASRLTGKKKELEADDRKMRAGKPLGDRIMQTIGARGGNNEHSIFMIDRALQSTTGVQKEGPVTHLSPLTTQLEQDRKRDLDRIGRGESISGASGEVGLFRKAYIESQAAVRMKPDGTIRPPYLETGMSKDELEARRVQRELRLDSMAERVLRPKGQGVKADLADELNTVRNESSSRSVLGAPRSEPSSRDTLPTRDVAPGARDAVADPVSQDLSSLPPEKRAQASKAITPIPKEVAARFVEGEKNQFFFDRERTKPAFVDKGVRLETRDSSPVVAESLVAIAMDRGWTTVQAKGSNDFRREVWFAAELAGGKAIGYAPTEGDRELLEKKLEQRGVNKRDASERANVLEPVNEKQAASDKSPETGKKRGLATAAVASEVAGEPIDPFEGVIVSHGGAKFKHRKEATASYFVELKNADGKTREVWGVDLQRALSEGKADVGDNVKLTRTGQIDLIVKENVLSSDGKVIGTRDKETVRNGWNAEKAETLRNNTASEAVKKDPSLLNAAASAEVYGKALANKYPESGPLIEKKMKEKIADKVANGEPIKAPKVRAELAEKKTKAATKDITTVVTPKTKPKELNILTKTPVKGPIVVPNRDRSVDRGR